MSVRHLRDIGWDKIGMKGMRILGLAALGAAFMLTAPVERAAALSLSNPAAATAVQDSAKVTTEVGWHHRHWHHRHWHHWHWHHRHWHHRHYW
jgi:hypothetical protein